MRAGSGGQTLFWKISRKGFQYCSRWHKIEAGCEKQSRLKLPLAAVLWPG